MPGHRPRVAISSCLLGNPVRYDGTGRFNDLVHQYLSGPFELVAFCPEAEAGLGVPRPPVRLTGDPAQPRALGVTDPGLDVTPALMRFADAWLAQAGAFSGLLLKSRSPSCGLRDTPVFDRRGQVLTHGPGLFSRMVIQCCPRLPVLDETGIADAAQRNAFIDAVQRYARTRPQA